MKFHISKVDAARRQLDTAISLYFNDKDAVSIHALASNALEILENLGKEKEILPFTRTQVIISIRPDKKKLLLGKLSEAHRFFKHAGSQQIRSAMKFNPELSEFVMWDSCLIYQQLCGEMTDHMKTFHVWFMINHDIFKEGHYKEITSKMKESNYQKGEFFELFFAASSLIKN